MHTTPPTFVNAHTARGVLHASHRAPVPRGTGYVALCGRTVRDVTTVAWNPNVPGGACAECINEVVRRARPEAADA